jgi:CRP/FNR family cyclic AMP-dependent transcriptional regulator
MRTICDPQAFPDSTGVAGTVARYRKAATIYSQGDVCETVMYLQKGEVQLSVRSKEGRHAIVAVLGPGDFFGEGALADQPLRAGSATANAPSTVFVIEKSEMQRVLHDGAEKRLARALLLLARYGEAGRRQRMIPKISQRTLADMAGITRSRVKFFMSKFRKLGFIETDHGFAINSSLLNVVLHD